MSGGTGHHRCTSMGQNQSDQSVTEGPRTSLNVIEEHLEVQRMALDPRAFAPDSKTPHRTAAGAILVDTPTGRNGTMLRLSINGSIVLCVADGYPLAIAFSKTV